MSHRLIILPCSVRDRLTIGSTHRPLLSLLERSDEMTARKRLIELDQQCVPGVEKLAHRKSGGIAAR